MVSGSLAYNTLGMFTAKEHKEHHSTYVLREDPPAKDEKLQKKLDYGTENEVKLL